MKQSRAYNVEQRGMADMKSLSAAEIKAMAGREIGVSNWIEVSQAKINAFADITGDWQFIHIDPERAARETPFGGAIAHGFLTLSLLSAMGADVVPRVEGIQMGVNYGFDKVRFVSPVLAGARVRGRFKMLSVEERNPGELSLTYGVEVEIEGSAKPALAVEWLTRQYYRAS
jgi:acyl dehydratase